MVEGPVSEQELETLIRCADQIIPGVGGWPSPREVGIDVFFRKIFTNEDDLARLRRVIADLAAAADVPVAEAEPDQMVAALEGLEVSSPVAFRVLLEFCYFGYYSRPPAIAALNRILDLDYMSPPQPFGYELSGADDPTPHGVGTFIPTDQVRRVDMTRLADAEQAEVGTGGTARSGNSATLFT